MAAGRYRLVDRYLADSGTVFLTGLQALARLPLEQLRADRRAGLNTAALISGYPGSPLGGYDGTVAAAAQLAPDLPVICRPAMNEEYAASAVMGSQLAAAQPDCLYDGIVGIWYGKSPGVDRATDALRHAVYAGTSMHGGAVAIVGDDPAAKSSTLPSSSAGALADMHMPVLYPGDPAEALDLGRHAIAMSRVTGLWSALKIVADVADATATVHLHPERIVPVLPRVDGELYRHRPDAILLAPNSVDREREIYEVRYELARQYAVENGLNAVAVDPPDAPLGIVASGITYREVREAFARLGIGSDDEIRAAGIRLLKMGMPLPFDAGTIRRFARGLREVFVIEEKQPNIEALIKDALYGLADRPLVVGKTDERGEALLPGHGALDADILVPILRRRIEARVVGVRLAPEAILPGRALAPLAVQRTPFFCSGCPHNRSTEVPEGSLVGAGIGCHTMVMLMDPERIGSITGVACMGNEGTQWIGMADFVARTHFVQNLATAPTSTRASSRSRRRSPRT
jgi:indolepyruvate ferredoxin oxidoreductase